MACFDLDYKSDKFLPDNNGVISETITKNWTEQALECYSLKGNCAGCSISEGNYSFACQMKKVVSLILKDIGEPKL